MLLPFLLAAVVELAGVTGESLTARAYFDANNVRVGDPMILTVDFVGEADFAALHPPALSRLVDKADWKLDDHSAKTDTFNDARRIVYRVRPRRQGVLWFPAIEYSYRGVDGGERTLKANAIPVHVKAGREVDVEGLGEDTVSLPNPDEYVTAAPEGLNDDQLFAWRKALAHPTADAFAEFDFPAAKLNEARAAILAGDWKRALKVYSRLEWTTGQTPAIERGIIAARARRFDSAQADLPVWREVGRPVLRYPLWGRVGIVGGALAALVLVFLLLGRLIRRFAAVALVFALFGALDGEAAPRGLSSFFNMQMPGMNMPEMPRVEVKANFMFDRESITVGEDFRIILFIDAPQDVTLDQIRLQPTNEAGLSFTGRSQSLADEKSRIPSNVVHRVLVPARYLVPVKGNLGFIIQGMMTVSVQINEGGFHSSMTSSQNFSARTPVRPLNVKPLPTDNQPEDFTGIIAEAVEFRERVDLPNPETNDVVSVLYTLRWQNGYLPQGFLPEGAAYESNRGNGSAEYRRYFVADGSPTPVCSFSYYNPTKRAYERVKAGGFRLRYRPTTE